MDEENRLSVFGDDSSDVSDAYDERASEGEIDEIKFTRKTVVLGVLLVAVVVLAGIAVIFNVPQTLYANLMNLFGGASENEEPSVVEDQIIEQPQPQVEPEPENPVFEEKEKEEESTTNETTENPEEVVLECAVEDMSIEINDGDAKTDDRDVTLTLEAKNAVQCRLRNEDSEWTDNETGWFDFDGESMEYDWRLSSGEEKKTVYLQCMDENGLISDEVSDSIRYKKSNSGGGSGGVLPTIEYLWLNNVGTTEDYTNLRRIVVLYKVHDASACYLSEGGTVWTSITCPDGVDDAAYFEVSDTEDRKTIYLKAVSNSGRVAMETVYVTYDITNPVVTDIDANELLSASHPRVRITWECTESATYKVYRHQGSSLFRPSPDSDDPGVLYDYLGETDTTEWLDSSVSFDETYSYYVVPTDMAGNEGDASPVVTIDISEPSEPEPPSPEPDNLPNMEPPPPDM